MEWNQERNLKRRMVCRAKTCLTKDMYNYTVEYNTYRSQEELRNALKVELKPEKDTYKPGDKVKAEIRVTNTGAGHRVPTG